MPTADLGTDPRVNDVFRTVSGVSLDIGPFDRLRGTADKVPIQQSTPRFVSASCPRIVLKDSLGYELDTYTTLQEAIYRAKWNVRTTGHAQTPLEWRLPKAPPPARPDLTRTFPPVKHPQLQAGHSKQLNNLPANILEIDVDDVSFVKESLDRLPFVPSLSFLRQEFLVGPKTYFQIVGTMLLHKKLLSETEKRHAIYNFPGFCSGCIRMGLCYGCERSTEPHYHEDKLVKTGGGFTYYKKDRPERELKYRNPINWKINHPDQVLKKLMEDYTGVALEGDISEKVQEHLDECGERSRQTRDTEIVDRDRSTVDGSMSTRQVTRGDDGRFLPEIDPRYINEQQEDSSLLGLKNAKENQSRSQSGDRGIDPDEVDIEMYEDSRGRSKLSSKKSTKSLLNPEDENSGKLESALDVPDIEYLQSDTDTGRTEDFDRRYNAKFERTFNDNRRYEHRLPKYRKTDTDDDTEEEERRKNYEADDESRGRKKERLYKPPPAFKLKKSPKRRIDSKSPFSTDRSYDFPKGREFIPRKSSKKLTEFVDFRNVDVSWKEPKKFELKKSSHKPTKFWSGVRSKKKEKSRSRSPKVRRAPSPRSVSPDSGLDTGFITAVSDPRLHNKKVYEARSGAISPIIYEGLMNDGFAPTYVHMHGLREEDFQTFFCIFNDLHVINNDTRPLKVARNSETILSQEYSIPERQDQLDKITNLMNKNKYQVRSEKQMKGVSRLSGEYIEALHPASGSTQLFDKTSREQVTFPRIAKLQTKQQWTLGRRRPRFTKNTKRENDWTLPKIKRNRYIATKESMRKKDIATLPPIKSKITNQFKTSYTNDEETNVSNLHMNKEKLLAKEDGVNFQIQTELYTMTRATSNSSNEKCLLSDDFYGQIRGDDCNTTLRSDSSFEPICSWQIDRSEQSHGCENLRTYSLSADSSTSDFHCRVELETVSNSTPLHDDIAGAQSYCSKQPIKYHKTIPPLFSRKTSKNLSKIGRNKHDTDPSNKMNLFQKGIELNDSLAQSEKPNCKSTSDEEQGAIQERYIRWQNDIDSENNADNEVCMVEETDESLDSEGLALKGFGQTAYSETGIHNFDLTVSQTDVKMSKKDFKPTQLGTEIVQGISDKELTDAYEFQESIPNDLTRARKKITKTHNHKMNMGNDNREIYESVENMFTTKIDSRDDFDFHQSQIIDSRGKLLEQSQINRNKFNKHYQNDFIDDRPDDEFRPITKKNIFNSEAYISFGNVNKNIAQSNRRKKHHHNMLSSKTPNRQTNDDYKTDSSSMSKTHDGNSRKQKNREKTEEVKDLQNNSDIRSNCYDALTRENNVNGCKQLILQPRDQRLIKEYSEHTYDVQVTDMKSNTIEGFLIKSCETEDSNFADTEFENDENSDLEIVNFSHRAGRQNVPNTMDDVYQKVRGAKVQLHHKDDEIIDKNDNVWTEPYEGMESRNTDIGRYSNDNDKDLMRESSSISLEFEDHSHSGFGCIPVADRKYSISSCNEHLDEKIYSDFRFPLCNSEMNDISNPETSFKTISGRKRSPYDNNCDKRESLFIQAKDVADRKLYSYDSSDSTPEEPVDNFEDKYYRNKLHKDREGNRGFSKGSTYVKQQNRNSNLSDKFISEGPMESYHEQLYDTENSCFTRESDLTQSHYDNKSMESLQKGPREYRQKIYSDRKLDVKSTPYVKEVSKPPSQSSKRNTPSAGVHNKKLYNFKPEYRDKSKSEAAYFSNDIDRIKYYTCNRRTAPVNEHYKNMVSDAEIGDTGNSVDRSDTYEGLTTRKENLQQLKYQISPEAVVSDSSSRQQLTMSESKRRDHHSLSETVLTYAKFKGSNKNMHKKIAREESNGSLRFDKQAEASANHMNASSQNESIITDRSVRNISVDMSTLSSYINMEESDSDASLTDNDVSNPGVVDATNVPTSTAYAHPVDSCTGSFLQFDGRTKAGRDKKGDKLKFVREELSPPHIPVDIAFDKKSLTSTEPDLELEFDDIIDVRNLEICPDENDLNKINRREDRRRRHKHRKKKRKHGHEDSERTATHNENDKEINKDAMGDPTDIEKCLESTKHCNSRDLDEIDDDSFLKSVQMIANETKRSLQHDLNLDSTLTVEKNVENRILETAKVENYTDIADENRYQVETEQTMNENSLGDFPNPVSVSPSSKKENFHDETDYSHFERQSIGKQSRDTSIRSTAGRHPHAVAQMVSKDSQVYGDQIIDGETNKTNKETGDARKFTIPQHSERRNRRKKRECEVIEVDFSELPSIQTQIAKIMYNYNYDGQANTNRSSSRSSKQSHRRHSVATVTTDSISKVYRSNSSCNNTRRSSIKSKSQQKRSRSLPHAADLKTLKDGWEPENVEILMNHSTIHDYEDSLPMRIIKKQFKTSKTKYIYIEVSFGQFDKTFLEVDIKRYAAK